MRGGAILTREPLWYATPIQPTAHYKELKNKTSAKLVTARARIACVKIARHTGMRCSLASQTLSGKGESLVTLT